MAQEGIFDLFSSLRYDPALQEVPSNEGFAYAGWNFKHKSPFYMLDFHRDRLVRAATYWGWRDAVSVVEGEAGLRNLEQTLYYAVEEQQGSEPLRCRVRLGMSGTLRCDVTPAIQTPLIGLLPPQFPPPGFMQSTGDADDDKLKTPLLQSLRAELSQNPYEVVVDTDGTASSAYTHYKTTERQLYIDAQLRAGISAQQRKEVLLINARTGMVMDGSLTTVYLWRNGRWVTPPVPPKFEHHNGSGGLDGTTRRWAIEKGLAVQDEIKADSLVDGEECWLSNGVRGFVYGKIKLPAAK